MRVNVKNITLNCNGRAGRIGNEAHRQTPPAAEQKRYAFNFQI